MTDTGCISTGQLSWHSSCVGFNFIQPQQGTCVHSPLQNKYQQGKIWKIYVTEMAFSRAAVLKLAEQLDR